jgi:hypothetical protein
MRYSQGGNRRSTSAELKGSLTPMENEFFARVPISMFARTFIVISASIYDFTFDALEFQ